MLLHLVNLPNSRLLLSAGRFDEGATQVKRMLNRDRQQLSGIGKEQAERSFKSEFAEAPAGKPSTSATPDNGGASPSSGDNPAPSPKPRAFGMHPSICTQLALSSSVLHGQSCAYGCIGLQKSSHANLMMTALSLGLHIKCSFEFQFFDACIKAQNAEPSQANVGNMALACVPEVISMPFRERSVVDLLSYLQLLRQVSAWLTAIDGSMSCMLHRHRWHLKSTGMWQLA